jgi:hypothetical protein
MPLRGVDIQAQQGHAQARPQPPRPSVPREDSVSIVSFTETQYTAGQFQRNNKSGRLRWVFSKAAARRQFATSA